MRIVGVIFTLVKVVARTKRVKQSSTGLYLNEIKRYNFNVAADTREEDGVITPAQAGHLLLVTLINSQILQI